MIIWLVTLFENTPVDDNQNTRYNSIIREATNRGHKVVLWASTFRHNIKQQRFLEDTTISSSENVTIKFVKTPGYNKNIGFIG